MKNYSQFQQIIAILIICTLLIEITGCSTSKAVQTSEITPNDKYVIHTQKTTYLVESAEITEGIFYCKLDFSKNGNGKSFKTHIYLSSDSALHFKDNVLSVPITSITKMEQRVPDPKKTKLLLASIGVAVGIGLITGLVVLVAAGINQVITVPQQTESTGMCTNW
jgi:hypothetical protein